MSPLRVLHLMGSLRPSGMERMFVSASPHFRNHKVTNIIIGQGDDHPFLGVLQKADYRTAVVPSLRSFRGALDFRRAVREYSPDVVHIHAEGAFAVSTLLIRSATKAPIVRTIHNVFQPKGRARLSRSIQGLIADRFIAEFVAPSPDVANNEQSFGRTARVILNWVADDYVPISQNAAGSQPVPIPKSAVIVGNCSKIKNHELALRSLLKAGYRVFHHGDEREASSEEIDLLNALEHRGDLAYRGTSAPLVSLRRAGVYVMPSTREGMPVALAEAMSLGVPCLVGDSPGVDWAKGIDGIEHAALEQRDWDNALPYSGYVRKKGHLDTPDLSAARGTLEYCDLYYSLVCGDSSHALADEDQKF
jgi:glycosyltransferase involved in cell wall biosynthesis